MIIKRQFRLFTENLTGFIKKYQVFILTFIYACVTLSFIPHHEMFQDEIDVWVVLTNIPLAELPKHVTLAGHPIIYFSLLYPFAKLGLPVEFLHFISWSSSVTAVFLLLRYSPFSFPTKLIITFSAPYLYWFPVVARSYSVFSPVIFTIAILYHKLSNYALRDKKYGLMIISFCLLSGFTANIHFIFDMLGGIIFIFYVWEQFIEKKEFNRYNITGAILFAILLLIPAIQTFFAFTVNLPIIDRTNNPYPTYLNIFSTGVNFLKNYTLIDIFIDIHAFTFFILLLLLLIRDKKVFTVVFLANLFHCLIYIFKYNVFLPHRTYCLHVILLFGFWLVYNKTDSTAEKNYFERKKISEFCLALLMLLSVPSGIFTAMQDWKIPFFFGNPMAEYINKNIPNDEKTKIYAVEPDSFIAVGFYLKDRDIYAESGEKIKYIKVYDDRSMKKLPIPKKGENILLISFADYMLDKNATTLFCVPKVVLPAPQTCLYRLNSGT